jgi:hypothetical protein
LLRLLANIARPECGVPAVVAAMDDRSDDSVQLHAARRMRTGIRTICRNSACSGWGTVFAMRRQFVALLVLMPVWP